MKYHFNSILFHADLDFEVAAYMSYVGTSNI